MNEIMRQKTAEEISRAYQSAKEKVQRAYGMLADAEKELKDALGDSVGYVGIYTVDNNVRAWNSDAPDRTTVEIMRKIKLSTWRRIIERLGVRQIMASKERDALDEKLSWSHQKYNDKGYPVDEVDEPTVENILALFMHYADSAPDKLNALVLEVFRLLTPQKYWNKEYKTNSQFKIGKKVILTNWCGYWTRREDDIFAIDRCFHILDGKRVGGYRGELNDALAKYNHYGSDTGSGETEYFRFTTYQNGNLHLEFKRMDLVEKINQIGGEGHYNLGKGKGK